MNFIYGFLFFSNIQVRYQPANVSLVDHLEDITTKSLDPLAKYGHGILKPISELFNFT